MTLTGDLNRDGRVDKDDLEILKAILSEIEDDTSFLDVLTPEQRKQLDINHDGQIDRDDLEALCEILIRGNTDASCEVKKEAVEKISGLRDKLRNKT